VSGWIAGKLQGAIGKNLTFPSCADIPLPPLLAADAPAAGLALPAFLAGLQDGAARRRGCRNVAPSCCGHHHKCQHLHGRTGLRVLAGACLVLGDSALRRFDWCPTGCQRARRGWAARTSIVCRRRRTLDCALRAARPHLAPPR